MVIVILKVILAIITAKIFDYRYKKQKEESRGV